MDFFDNMLWLAERAVAEAMHFSTPLAVLVASNLFLAALSNSPFHRPARRLKHLRAFVPFVLPAAILTWGALMRQNSEGLAPAWPQYVISVLLALHIPATVYCIKRMKGYRWFAFSISLFQLWCSFAAALAATMAVRGELL